MGIIDNLNDNITDIKGDGDHIIETGEDKVSDAQNVRSVFDGVDVIDEDTQSIIDCAVEGAREVAIENSDTYIKTPMKEVSDELSEVKNQATEYSNIETSNSEKASVTSGDYEAVGAQAEGEFEQHAAEFDESGEGAQEINDRFKEQAANLSNLLETMI